MSHKHSLGPRNEESGPLPPPSSSTVPYPPELSSLDFDVLSCSIAQLIIHCEQIFEAHGLITETSSTAPEGTVGIRRNAFGNFVSAVAGYYHTVPYHSFHHAFSVMQAAHVFLRSIPQFSPLQQMTLLLSALLHDVDHPGLNNPFQVKSKSPLYDLYQDRSPLERHHLAVGMNLCEKFELFGLLSFPQELYLRERMEDMILATDLSNNKHSLARIHHQVSRGIQWGDAEWENVMLLGLLKCADLGTDLRPKHESEQIMQFVESEFIRQSELELELGLPLTFPGRKEAPEKAVLEGQVGFDEHVCLPLFEPIATIFPVIAQCVVRLQDHVSDYRRRIESLSQ